MAFSTLTLRDSVNRWTNVIVSIVYIILTLVDLTDYLAEPTAYEHAILQGIVAIVLLALIAWYAYRWPKQEK
jgi:hypothetical protein